MQYVSSRLQRHSILRLIQLPPPGLTNLSRILQGIYYSPADDQFILPNFWRYLSENVGFWLTRADLRGQIPQL